MFKSTSYKPVPDASTQPLNPPGSVDSQGQQKGAPQRGSNPISSKKEEKKKKKNSKNKQVPLVQKAKQVRMAQKLTPGMSWYQRYKLYKKFRKFKKACCCCLEPQNDSVSPSKR